MIMRKFLHADQLGAGRGFAAAWGVEYVLVVDVDAVIAVDRVRSDPDLELWQVLVNVPYTTRHNRELFRHAVKEQSRVTEPESMEAGHRPFMRGPGRSGRVARAQERESACDRRVPGLMRRPGAMSDNTGVVPGAFFRSDGARKPSGGPAFSIGFEGRPDEPSRIEVEDAPDCVVHANIAPVSPDAFQRRAVNSGHMDVAT